MRRALLLALGTLLARPVAASPPAPPATAGEPVSRPADTLWLDAAVTAGAGAGWLGLHLATPHLVETTCPCQPADAPALERFAVEQRLSWGEPLADGLFAAGVGLSLAAVLAAAPADRGSDDRLHDGLIVLQSAAVAGLLSAGLKAAVGRPYPYMFGPAPYPGQDADGINYASFPSGHTAVPMAAAVSAARIFERRHPHSGWRWLVWTLGPALALAAGAAQITAANHFPTDVIGGAALGAGIGLLDPWLHGI